MTIEESLKEKNFLTDKLNTLKSMKADYTHVKMNKYISEEKVKVFDEEISIIKMKLEALKLEYNNY